MPDYDIETQATGGRLYNLGRLGLWLGPRLPAASRVYQITCADGSSWRPLFWKLYWRVSP